MPDRGQWLGGLLPDLLDPDVLDPGYARAAARRRQSEGRQAAGGNDGDGGDGSDGGGGEPARGRAQTVALLIGGLLVGLVLGIAAADATARAPGAEQARRGLVDDVQDARQRTDGLAATAADLGARLQQAQRQALAGSAQGAATLDEVRWLEQAAAAVPVTGPGLRITVADAGEERTVLDRDLQVLVNGVWAAGAEAVALGGVRLHPRATVRQAGGAVLVDNRPVAQPYVLEAIGDPATLHTRLIDTDAYGRFATFTQVYGTEFTVEPAPSLTLPAGAAAEPELAKKGG